VTWFSSPQEAAYHADIKNAIDFIDQHYVQTLKLEEIARQANLSSFHFARLFKQVTGFSVMEYVFKLRLTKAKQMLITTVLPIGDIAQKVGYDDQSYFGKLFKRIERMTPTEFREHRRR
jgi:transcriptional regulator GlxA family with amidase domain